MGFIASLVENRATKASTTDVGTPPEWLLGAWGGGTGYTGKRVTIIGSRQVVAVRTCVKILAETISSLPLAVFRRLQPRGQERDPQHPLYPILHDLPNPEMTSVDLLEAAVGHMALWGNAYHNVVRDTNGNVTELWPLRPDRMIVERDRATGQLRYLYTMLSGEQIALTRQEVSHWPLQTHDGIMGYSPIQEAREAIGLAMATEEFGARFFGNDSSPRGILKHPSTLSDPALKHLKESWEQVHRGLDNAHRVAILEEGMDWQSIGVPPEDAQFLETRKFQITEIARLFRIPPHMLADLERATFSNIEQQSIEFVVFTLMPWLVRIEKAIFRDMLTPAERQVWYPKFVVAGLLRGDIKSRYEAYALGRQNGWLSANDIHELEEMNPIKGGDVYYVPLNWVPADEAGQQQPAAGGQGQGARTAGDWADSDPWAKEMRERIHRRSASRRRKIGASYRRLFSDAAVRVVTRETNEVKRAAEKYLGYRSTPEFVDWLRNYYLAHPAAVERAFMPVLMSYGEEINANAAEEIGKTGNFDDVMQRFIRDYAGSFARDWAASSAGQLMDVVTKAEAAGQDPLEAVLERLGEWELKRPDKTANRQTTEAGGAVVRQTWKGHGVRKLEWDAYGENCPYCNHLNGKIVGIEEAFVGEGEDFQPDGADGPLRPSRQIHHPPLHDGCNCGLRPV